MRITLAAALSVALVAGLFFACGGELRGTLPAGDGGIPVLGGSLDSGVDGGSDAGDGGSDAGDAGASDAGLDAGDGGCGHGFVAQGFDGCFSGDASVQLAIILSGCDAIISINTIPRCNGQLTGAQDSFDGGCGDLVCSAPALPGLISCTGGGTSCSIRVCPQAGGSCL